MARLCSEGDGGWLLSSHMEYIMNKMMTSQEHTLCFCLNATHALTRMTRLQEQLEHFKDIKRLVFTMNVGKLPDNSVYIGGDIQPGNHWTLAVVKLVTGEVLYCDSMAWGLPEELCPRLQEYTSFFDKILSPSSIKMCHTRTPVAEVHTCDPSCTNYPLQTWSDLCGVVAIITAAIATFDQPFFNFLCGPKNKGQFYLRNPTRCSKYLRLVLISWFVSGRISINNVSLKKLPKAQPVMFAQGKVKGRSTQKRKRSSSQSEGSTEKTSIKHKKEPNDLITPADIQMDALQSKNGNSGQDINKELDLDKENVFCNNESEMDDVKIDSTSKKTVFQKDGKPQSFDKKKTPSTSKEMDDPNKDGTTAESQRNEPNGKDKTSETPTKPYVCPYCQLQLSSRQSLHRHKKTLHPKEKKEEPDRASIQCTMCKTFQ
ncbi:uncharacterized protein [Eucyclogobius newberryi]|uniref:uncharacterized protein n=1 Tax=Eucyclogobius newberryi TaxID=166745 RepID=UPI003B5A03E0